MKAILTILSLLMYLTIFGAVAFKLAKSNLRWPAVWKSVLLIIDLLLFLMGLLALANIGTIIQQQ